MEELLLPAMLLITRLTPVSDCSFQNVHSFCNISLKSSGPVLQYSQYSATPDDDVFRHLALTYSFNHMTMHRGDVCPDGTPGFPNGTTNGAKWYQLIGNTDEAGKDVM